MRDIDRALADITNIRSQLAAGTLFRGFGPAVIGMSGGLAFLTATLQSLWPDWLAAPPFVFLSCWVVTAIIAVCLIGGEMLARSRRHHGGMADAMIFNAVELFLPAGFAGAAIGLVLLEFAPDSVWLLPGLWQVLVALGLFASLRFLPRAISFVGAWYFLCGIGVLMMASGEQILSPWMMGLPFGIGQVLMAMVLHMAPGGVHDDA